MVTQTAEDFDTPDATDAAIASVLIIDDEPIAIKNLSYVLNREGYKVTTRSTGTGGFKALEDQVFDVVITDLKMDKVDGMGILKKAQEVDPDLPVILLTGHGSYDSVVKAMKMGAYHYLSKPYQLDDIREIVKNALELVHLKRENKRLKSRISDKPAGVQILSQDPHVLSLVDTMRQIAPSDCNVIISGENGTGRELAARFIHANSPRHKQPFIVVNCSALQEEILSSELFGGTDVSGTKQGGLLADTAGGTLFLDEIDQMPPGLQVKLLRTIQEKAIQSPNGKQNIPINVRFLAATNQDLEQTVSNGQFREDLFYRLNIIYIHLPPLTERTEDIALLAYYFLKKHRRLMDKVIDDFEPEVIEALNQYHFPGNIRELENLIERAVVLATGNTITLAQLPSDLTDHSLSVMRFNKNRLPTLDEQEIEYIKWVLDKCGGNRTRAAAILGIDRVSLWRKIKKNNL